MGMLRQMKTRRNRKVALYDIQVNDEITCDDAPHSA